MKFNTRDYTESFVEAILQNIEFNKEESEYITVEVFGLYTFNKDFRTIRLSLPRQNGNTSIAMFLKDRLENSCLVVPKDKDASRMLHTYELKRNDIYTESDLDMSKILKMSRFEFDYVIVDMASRLDRRSIDNMWGMLKPKFFIFLQ